MKEQENISFIKDRDVLGLEKPRNQKQSSYKISKWIYVALVIILIAAVYLVFTFDSRSVHYFSDSKKISNRGNFDREGHQNGKWTEYYLSGAKKEETTYFHGTKDGWDLSWYENGQKESENYYKNGSHSGSSLQWFDNGIIQEECNYVNGLLEGKYFSRFKNGKPYSEMSFKNGKEDGAFTQRDSLGNLIRDEIYEEGKLLKKTK